MGAARYEVCDPAVSADTWTAAPGTTPIEAVRAVLKARGDDPRTFGGARVLLVRSGPKVTEVRVFVPPPHFEVRYVREPADAVPGGVLARATASEIDARRAVVLLALVKGPRTGVDLGDALAVKLGTKQVVQAVLQALKGDGLVANEARSRTVYVWRLTDAGVREAAALHAKRAA